MKRRGYSKELKQDCLYQTERMTINSWSSIEQSANKEQLFRDVLKIMTPKVTKDLPDGWQNLTTIKETETWATERKSNSYFYVIQNKDGKEMIGFLFLYTENETKETIDLR